MATRYHRQASRSSLRIPLYLLQLALILASAAIVAFVLWQALAAFLSMGSYIETVVP